MMAAEHCGKRTRDMGKMTWLDSIIIGLWQVLAMIPGISRSSATISGAMLRDFNAQDAARFSFLMSIPALLGAGVVALKDLFEMPGLLASLAAPLAVGFFAAAISGYFSIRWLFGYLKTRPLNRFVIYRFAFGAIVPHRHSAGSASRCWRLVAEWLACCAICALALYDRCDGRAGRVRWKRRKSRGRRSNCVWPKQPIKPPCSIGW